MDLIEKRSPAVCGVHLRIGPPRATSRCSAPFSPSVIGAEGSAEGLLDRPSNHLTHSQHDPTLDGVGGSLLHFTEWA
jgi:hypothetical protein